MEWDHTIDLSRRKFSSRLIVERALARGWRVAGFKSNMALFLLYIPGREKPVRIFSAAPPQTSYAASKMTKDKFVTNQILGAAGLPVPDELLLESDTPAKDSEAFLKKHGEVVVKPLDASHGNGITVGVKTMARLEKSVKAARTASARNRVLVQQQVEGMDIRMLCINYKFVDSITRIPASVVGDGVHTVKELIEITNQSDDRGENYKARLNVIPLDKAEDFLGKTGMKRVPAKGEDVQVIGVSNVGMGGIRQNIKDQVPDWLKAMAEKAAEELELPVCGVDFMVRELPTKQSTQETLAPAIIEVNECPMLTMYEDLHSPEQYAVIDKYLDLLAAY